MIYYYGLSADPITIAHIDILKSIYKRLGENDKLMIGVVNNDEKNYKALGSDRMAMVFEMLHAKFDMEKGNIEVKSQSDRTYKFLCDYIAANGLKMKDITIVVGQDEWNSLCSGKWVNWDLLLKHFEFLAFWREGMDDTIVMPKFGVNVEFTSFDITHSVSSSQVRDILSRNPDCHYEDVKDYITHQAFRYIKEHKLYNQNGFDYFEKDEKEFLNVYETKKFKNAMKLVLKELKEDEKLTDEAEAKIMKVVENAYGEPSVTTDTIAYNGDQILLIRRKKPPFQNFWALPGGFFEKTDEDLAFGAARELREETSLEMDPSQFVQIKTYGHNFDPRMKVVDTAFSVRIPKKMMDKAKADDDAAEHRWFNINDLPKLAFHHEMIIKDWLRNKENA